MRNCALILILLLLVGADTMPSPAPDQNSPATRPADPVAVLIAQLDDPDFSVRATAEARLEEMGPPIEPQLQAALHGNLSDEARARINHLIAKFDETRSMHALITLHYHNAPAVQVLRDFAAQAGTDLGIDDPLITKLLPDRSITINLDSAGFWQALTAVEDALGLTPCVGQTGVTIARTQASSVIDLDLHSPVNRIVGGVLIYPLDARPQSVIFYHAPQKNIGIVSVEIDVIPEPRLRVIGMSDIEIVKECVDERGNSLLQPGSNRRPIVSRMIALGGPRLVWWPIGYTIRDFPGMGKKIARLRGAFDLNVQTRTQTAEIDDITRAANTTKDDGQLAITVLSCSRVGQVYEIDLRLRGATLNNSLFQEFRGSLQLVDETGAPIPNQTFIPRQQPDGVYIRVGFLPTNAVPAKLRWERTLEQKRVIVPFELNDLSLQ